MNQRTHKRKIELARRIQSVEERKQGTSHFEDMEDTGWARRKKAIAARVKKQQDKAHQRAVDRREKSLQT